MPTRRLFRLRAGDGGDCGNGTVVGLSIIVGTGDGSDRDSGGGTKNLIIGGNVGGRWTGIDGGAAIEGGVTRAYWDEGPSSDGGGGKALRGVCRKANGGGGGGGESGDHGTGGCGDHAEVTSR